MLKRICVPARIKRPVPSGKMSPFLPMAYSLRKPPPSSPSSSSQSMDVATWCTTRCAPGDGLVSTALM